MEKIKRFLKEEEGATMLEYGLMLVLIAAVVMVAVGPFGTATANLFNRLP